MRRSPLNQGTLSQPVGVPSADTPSISFFAKQYKPKSQAFPTLQANPNIWAFTQQVTNEIQQTKKEGNFPLQYNT